MIILHFEFISRKKCQLCKLVNNTRTKHSRDIGLRSRVNKFAFAGCNACLYVGETTRHFFTRVREHQSAIFKHLLNSEHCRALRSVDCFHILDHASTSFQRKIKEAFHIQREQPSLNQQLHHVNLKLSFQFSHGHVLGTFRCYQHDQHFFSNL